MGHLMKSFWKEEDALETVEMVLLLAVLVAIALLFSGTVKGWVTTNLDNALPNDVTNNTVPTTTGK